MKLDRSLYLHIVSDALYSMPRECVGILSGLPDTAEAVSVYSCGNIAEDPCHQYRVSVEEQELREREMAARGHVPLAIYHSHPSQPPDPSPFDTLTAFNPVVYIIVGLDQLPDVSVRAYRRVEEIWVREPLEVG